MPTSTSITELALALCRAELEAGSVWRLPNTHDAVQLPPDWIQDRENLQCATNDRPLIIAIHQLTPSAVTGIKIAKPTLLLLTGDHYEDPLVDALQTAIPDLQILGPRASLKITPRAKGVWLALDRAQLSNQELTRGAPARLTVCPTPDWLLSGILELAREGQPICGWINTASLSVQWRELLQKGSTPLLQTVGPQLCEAQANPWEEGLEAMALAQDLQAPLGLDFAGPACTLAHLADPDHSSHHADPWEPTAWDSLFSALARAQGLKLEPAARQSPLRRLSPLVAHWVERAQTQRQRWQAWAQASKHVDDAHLDASADAERSLQVLQAAAESLTDHESKVVLRGWGFEVTRQAVGKSASAALSYAQKIGYPVALKAISPRLRQKSAVDCVTLGVANASSLKRHYQKINDRAVEEVGEEQLDGVLVSEMVPEGLDIRVRALKGSSSAWVLYARCINAKPEHGLAPEAWGFLESEGPFTLRFADRVIPQQLPQRQDAVRELATELHKLIWPLQELSPRLFCIELDPLRILLPEHRPATVLDAYIEQDAHIHGA